MSGWAHQPLTGFALATTAIDPGTARIVAFAHRTINDGHNGPAQVHVVSTTDPIPAGASAVHGITDQDTAAGTPLEEVLTALTALLNEHAAAGHGVVIFNSGWFLTVVRAEAARIGFTLDWPADLPIIDPSIIDKHLTPARAKGNRTLPALCRTWGIQQDAYGPPATNANAALHLAWQIGSHIGAVADMTVPELVQAQRDWWREDREEFLGFLAAHGKVA